MTGPEQAPRPGPGPGFTVTGLPGFPEVVSGTDLAALIAGAAPGLADGDILVITSKIVSKAEGRVVSGDRESANRRIGIVQAFGRELKGVVEIRAGALDLFLSDERGARHAKHADLIRVHEIVNVVGQAAR